MKKSNKYGRKMVKTMKGENKIIYQVKGWVLANVK